MIPLQYRSNTKKRGCYVHLVVVKTSKGLAEQEEEEQEKKSKEPLAVAIEFPRGDLSRSLCNIGSFTSSIHSTGVKTFFLYFSF